METKSIPDIRSADYCFLIGPGVFLSDLSDGLLQWSTYFINRYMYYWFWHVMIYGRLFYFFNLLMKNTYMYIYLYHLWLLKPGFSYYISLRGVTSLCLHMLFLYFNCTNELFFLSQSIYLHVYNVNNTCLVLYKCPYLCKIIIFYYQNS